MRKKTKVTHIFWTRKLDYKYWMKSSPFDWINSRSTWTFLWLGSERTMYVCLHWISWQLFFVTFILNIFSAETIFQKNPNKAYSMVLKALQCGYRYIDTATIYCNERQVGKAITDFLSNDPALDRKQLFITTKLPMNGMRKNKVEYFLRRSLSFLNLDYVDLYLIHAPFAVKVSQKGPNWSTD